MKIDVKNIIERYSNFEDSFLEQANVICNTQSGYSIDLFMNVYNTQSNKGAKIKLTFSGIRSFQLRGDFPHGFSDVLIVKERDMVIFEFNPIYWERELVLNNSSELQIICSDLSAQEIKF